MGKTRANTQGTECVRIIKEERKYFRNISGVSAAPVVWGVDYTIFTGFDRVLRFEVITRKIGKL